MTIPTHLNHKPIIGVEHYDQNDGIYSGSSDAKALSIGRAQYDHETFSAKVFRHVDGQWSRQSEELPLHRVLDLAILTLAAMTGRPAPVSVHLMESMIDNTDIANLEAFFSTPENREIFRTRLNELRRLLEMPELTAY